MYSIFILAVRKSPEYPTLCAMVGRPSIFLITSIFSLFNIVFVRGTTIPAPSMGSIAIIVPSDIDPGG